ncbi:hypothetical protein V5799_025142 [Amblyomma americanum]|uniref:Uncharacterized protein n=1 Tax=Amblyomma americanum TaxID=6943 RepID=A0AAQ4EA44_AMBAM
MFDTKQVLFCSAAVVATSAAIADPRQANKSKLVGLSEIIVNTQKSTAAACIFCSSGLSKCLRFLYQLYNNLTLQIGTRLQTAHEVAAVPCVADPRSTATTRGRTPRAMPWRKFVPGRATVIVTGWMTFIYWGWLQISQNDVFVPPEDRRPPPHVLLRDYVAKRWNLGRAGDGGGGNKGSGDLCFV